MKRHIFISCSTLIVGIGLFFACAMDEDFGEKKTQMKALMMLEEYEKIGKKHNEGLEAAFTEFRKYHQVQKRADQTTKKLNKCECLAIMNKGLENYLRKEGYEIDAVQTRTIKSGNTIIEKK